MTSLRCTELFSSSVSSICHQLHSTKTCEIYLQRFHVFICLLIVCLICLCIICSFSTLITASPSEDWRRPPGRPRTMWMNTIQQDLRSNNLSLDEAITVAQNCPLWRVETDVCVWRYAPLVVHATQEEEEEVAWQLVWSQCKMSAHWWWSIIGCCEQRQLIDAAQTSGTRSVGLTWKDFVVICCDFYARQHICYSAYILSPICLSVCLLVRQTGGSYKNGWR